jgi:hypothetical protein
VADKCRFFKVKHKWENNRWTLENKIDPTFSLHVTDDHGTQHKITQECNNQGELALGIMFAPNGNMDNEAAYLQKRQNNGVN